MHTGGRCKPYLLNLCLPGDLQPDDDESGLGDREIGEEGGGDGASLNGGGGCRASYDPSLNDGTITATLPKLRTGEVSQRCAAAARVVEAKQRRARVLLTLASESQGLLTSRRRWSQVFEGLDLCTALLRPALDLTPQDRIAAAARAAAPKIEELSSSSLEPPPPSDDQPAALSSDDGGSGGGPQPDPRGSPANAPMPWDADLAVDLAPPPERAGTSPPHPPMLQIIGPAGGDDIAERLANGLKISPGTSYGFGGRYSGVFKHLREELVRPALWSMKRSTARGGQAC